MLYFMVDRLECSTGLIILFFLVGRSTGFECCISWSASLNRPMRVKCTSNHKRCAYNTTRGRLFVRRLAETVDNSRTSSESMSSLNNQNITFQYEKNIYAYNYIFSVLNLC